MRLIAPLPCTVIVDFIFISIRYYHYFRMKFVFPLLVLFCTGKWKLGVRLWSQVERTKQKMHKMPVS